MRQRAMLPLTEKSAEVARDQQSLSPYLCIFFAVQNVPQRRLVRSQWCHYPIPPLRHCTHSFGPSGEELANMEDVSIDILRVNLATEIH